MLVDSHTHLYLDEFAPSPRAAVQRAIDAGVGHMMFPNVDTHTIAPMKELASSFPRVIDMAMGLHPTEVNQSWKSDVDTVVNEINTGCYKAVGEIGIDLYWDRTYLEEQSEAFDIQCRLAAKLDLPVIIHCREGLDVILEIFDTLDVIPRGVFHSFSGSAEDVDLIRQRGDFYFGINGIVTFKNSKLSSVLPVIGIDRLLLETDSPYLAPVPMRGKRNESAYLVHTARFTANALGVDMIELERVTTDNYRHLFGDFD